MQDSDRSAAAAAMTPILTELRAMAADCVHRAADPVWTVGFSGGLDSTVLLHGLAQLRADLPFELRAVHVHHGLMVSADAWAEHCATVCQQLEIPLHIDRVKVERAGRGLEAAARRARYAAFRACVGDGVLWLAHHAQDQVETIVQRLARAGGALGLAGIPKQRRLESGAGGNGYVVRPLLDVSRVRLEAYATAFGLNWVEDESNLDTAYERNWIRHTLLPVWRQRHPQIDQSLCRVAQYQRDTQQLLDEVAQADLDNLAVEASSFLFTPLQSMTRERAHNVLRFWLRQRAGYAPGQAALDELFKGVMVAAADAQPRFYWHGFQIKRYQQRLYLVEDPLPVAPAAQSVSLAKLEAAPLAFSFGRICTDHARIAEPVGGFSRTRLAAADHIQIEFRRGGERLKPVGQKTNDLKHWFQRWQVPPWQRGLWPLLKVDGVIAGLPGLCVCAGFEAQCAADELPLVWRWAERKATAD